MRNLAAIAAALVCAGLVATDAEAQRFDRDGRGGGRDRWVELGCKQVHFIGTDRDAIRVRSMIRQGTRTRPLDLRGRERSIRQIDMVYRKPLNFRGMATVCAEGLE